MADFDAFLAFRRRIRAFAESLEPDALVRIPDGFRNNALWNLGHLVVTQQLLTYGLAGLPLGLDEDLIEGLKKGSSPEQWSATPDAASLFAQLTEGAERLVADHRAGRFTSFETYTTSAGVELRSIEDAIDFVGLHDGIHVGYCMAMLRAR